MFYEVKSYSFLGIPEGSLVILIGVPGSGKSSWARQCFPASNILSSDKFREMLTDDENNQECSGRAFDLLRQVAFYRIQHGYTTVIDATNTRVSDRSIYLAEAWMYHRPTVGIHFNTMFEECLKRDANRNRTVGREVITKFWNRINQDSMANWDKEFDYLFTVHDNGQIVRGK